MNKFRKWIQDNGGPRYVAPKIGMTERVVYNWIEGKGSPTAKNMHFLVAYSGKKFDYNDIINCTLLKQK